MPTTLQALIIVYLAVLPGALYTWAFEQQAGRWGATAVDRVQRFLGASAVFLVVEVPLLYELYRRFLVDGVIRRGEALPPWVWALPFLFVAAPMALGRVTGRAAYQRTPWVRVLTGPAPAPRAWDDLFGSPELTGWLRLRRTDGQWIGGLWGESPNTGLKSYAAGYPESQDLSLADVVDTDIEVPAAQ